MYILSHQPFTFKTVFTAMDLPPFNTFASVTRIDTEETCFHCSPTHAQCEQLIKRLHAVAKRGENEGAGKEVRLRRLWPFYKAFSENESASQECYKQHPGHPPFNRRTLMALSRAKVWKGQAAEIMRNTLSKYIDIEADLQSAFDTILPSTAEIERNREELGEVGMEWKHWVTLLSSFKIIAQVHPLYRRIYLYEGPTI